MSDLAAQVVQTPAAPRHERSYAARMAHMLDSRFRIPGTRIRFGLDAILGLIPGVGDTISFLLACTILVEARARAVRWRVIARMLANIGLDWLIGLVPVAGDIFDVFYKANLRNLSLLERELARHQSRPTSV